MKGKKPERKRKEVIYRLWINFIKKSTSKLQKNPFLCVHCSWCSTQKTTIKKSNNNKSKSYHRKCGSLYSNFSSRWYVIVVHKNSRSYFVMKLKMACGSEKACLLNGRSLRECVRKVSEMLEVHLWWSCGLF